MFNKIKIYILGHKIVSAVILVAVIFVGQWGYKKLTSTTGDTRYITAQAAKSTVIQSVSGTGQVSASNQISITPQQVSGNITSIEVQSGQKVTTGTLIATVDSTSAQKSVRDAQLNLDTANISLQQLKIQNSASSLSSDSAQVYQNSFTTVSNTYLDLLPTLNGLDTVINSNELSDNVVRANSPTAQNYRDSAITSDHNARTAFQKNATDFALLTYNSSPQDIENIVNETYKTTQILAGAINDATTLVNFLQQGTTNQTSQLSALQNTLSSYSTKINADVTQLFTAQTNINNNKTATPTANLNLQSAELSVQQRQNALQDAKDALANYSIRAPFDGTIASVAIQKSDAVSGSTTIATLITKNQIAEMSLNEVDVSSVQLGQKATLTFDAIPDLTIAGTVAEIDSVGTVSQGVVNYNVQINFDTQDDRVKPGMSFSAEIITTVKQDVLTVPNSAIKTQNGTSYVQMFSTPLPVATDGLAGSISKTPPTSVPVVIGISNDTSTEIVSGINEGDSVVTRTILPSATTTATATAPSLLGGAGGARGGFTGGAGGGTRAGGAATGR